MGEKTPIPCDHPERTPRTRGACYSCYQQAWSKAHPEANTASGWRRKNPDKARILDRRGRLKRIHGITEKDFEAMWIAQRGKCANPRCDSIFPLNVDDYRRGLQVDHDHKTGRVRSLLCGPCNRALAGIDDDIGRLTGLVEYLQNNQSCTAT